MATDIERFYSIPRREFDQELRHYSENYYTGTPTISDEQFDKLVDIYQLRFGERHEVGAPVRGEKFPLPTYMGSMRKVKDKKELARWAKSYPGPYLVQDKADGISLLYDMDKRRLYTRGDGYEGMDVSHLLKEIDIPKMYTGEGFLIRGEAVIYKQDSLASDISSRNIVAGLVNSKEITPHTNKIKFIAYNIIGRQMPPEQELDLLKRMGFTTIWYRELPADELKIKELNSLLEERLKDTNPYDIDGLVLVRKGVQREVQLIGENPKDMIAYKGDSPTAQVKVVDVEWKASKDNRLVPTIVYEQVFLSGANLQKATGCNAKFILNNRIGPGAIIEISRRGSVNPHVESVIESAEKASTPDPKIIGPYKFDDVDFILLKDTQEVLASRLLHFVNILEIKGLGPGRTKKLVEAGIDTSAKLVKATTEELQAIQGMGKKTSTTLIDEIKNKTTRVHLSKLMAASNIFPSIGVKRAKTLVDTIPNILSKDVDKLRRVKGLDKLADEFYRAIPDFIEWLKEHPEITWYPQSTDDETIDDNSTDEMSLDEGWYTLNDHVVVFSGFRDKNIEEQILDRGGQVRTTVSKNTTIVVTLEENKESETAKLMKARDLGKPILSREQFIANYLA